MKFTCTIEIDRPIEEVVTLWKDESNYEHWQEGFQSKELLSGEKGQVGAKSKILLSSKNQKMELIETIEINNLPEEHKVYVEHIHMCNYMTTKFISLSEKQTMYSTTVEYTQFNGFMPKLMAKLFPSMFRKQVQKWLDQFKGFAEKND